MQKERVRVEGSNSVFSRNKNGEIVIESSSTSKNIPYEDIVGELDAYGLFIKERGSCNNYRINININPFCTNALYNACTEIIKDECLSSQKVVTDEDSATFDKDVKDYILGKNTNVYRYDMIKNTEYSNSLLGYDYKCGIDIFNNHILRNNVFRTVNRGGNKNSFNTLDDTMRYSNGDNIIDVQRGVDGSGGFIIKNNELKRLYTPDDVDTAEESYANNICEENGWFGFYNKSNIITYKDDRHNVPMDINKVINSRYGCDFIDMYPDRTLFLFNPKINKETKLPVYNWEEVITYPFENFYNHNIVSNYRYVDSDGTYVKNETDNIVNALYCIEGNLTRLPNGGRGLLLRTATKSSIKRNDYVYVYFSDDKEHTYSRTDSLYRVLSVGNENKEHTEYYFSLDGIDLYREILGGSILDIYYKKFNTKFDLPADIRDRNCIVLYEIPNEIPTPYQTLIQVYSYEKIPNKPSAVVENVDEIPRIVTEESPVYIQYDVDIYQKRNYYYVLKDDVSDNVISFELSSIDIELKIDNITEKYISTLEFRINKANNGVESQYYFRRFRRFPNFNSSDVNIDKETAENKNKYLEFVNDYDKGFFHKDVTQLAFANTIYNDNCTQVTITDTINTDFIVDNLKRPILSLYVTIIKRNSGYKQWYGVGVDEQKFNDETIDFTHCFGKLLSGIEMLSLEEDSVSIRNKKRVLSDIFSLYDYKEERKAFVKNTTYNTYEPVSFEEWEDNIDGINEKDKTFLGDLVEFEPYKCVENILSDVLFRFNTAQREYGGIWRNGKNQIAFKYDTLEYDENLDAKFSTKEGAENLLRKEGYYYKPHYEIPIRSLGTEIHQGCHNRISISAASPYQTSEMNILIKSKTNHGLSDGDEIFICNDRDNLWYKSIVISVINPYLFVIKKIEKEVEYYDNMLYVDWVSTCLHLNGAVIYDLLEDFVPQNAISLSDVPKEFNDNNPEYIEVDGKYYQLSTQWVIRKKNHEIPIYATKINTNLFLWRDVFHIGYEDENNKLPEYVYANDAMYVDRKINFFLRRQDGEGVNKLLYVKDFPDVVGTIYDNSGKYVEKITPLATC